MGDRGFFWMSGIFFKADTFRNVMIFLEKEDILGKGDFSKSSDFCECENISKM